MKPSNSLIKQVKLIAGDRVSQESLERSLAMLEAVNPIGALMSTFANRDFRETLIDVAEDRPEPETLAWMTVAAAGRWRTRRALLSRAVRIVAPHTLVDVLLSREKFAEACAVQAEAATEDNEWGAWLLLGTLRPRDVRRAAKAQPDLRRRLQEAPRHAKRPVNPQLHVQRQKLDLA